MPEPARNKWLLRGSVALILLVYGFQFSKKINDVAADRTTCVCAYDGFGYYLYLPQFFQKGNLRAEQEWAQSLQDRYCDSTHVYQLYHTERGSVDIYHMGLAMIELPAFLAGDFGAKAFGYPQDGFSKPYHIAFLLNAFLFVVLGMVFLLKLLRLFFPQQLVAALLIVCFFGTNYWVMVTDAYGLPHHYLFAIIAAFAYFLLKAWQNNKFRGKAFNIAVFLFGLCCVIRPTHALLGIFPMILLWKQLPRRAYWGRMSLFALSAFVWNIPQLIYWKMVGGSWLMMNLHVEDLVLTDPHLADFLMGFRKGWLIYTPVFLLLLPGFFVVWKKRREFFWPLLITTVVFVWAFASWECWWYASSFGARVMIDLYPLLLIPIGFLFLHSGQRIKIGVGILTGLFLVLNIFQSFQFWKGFIHDERMTADHYAYVFGKMQISGYDEHRLLIDRSDTSWVERVASGNFPEQTIRKMVLFESKKQMTAIPGKDLDITKFPFYGPLKTDETLLEVDLEYSIESAKGGEQSSLLRLEMVSKFNCYHWETRELALGKMPGALIHEHFRFNLSEINHQKDQLQVYIDNDAGGKIILYHLKLTAYSLVRK